MLTSGVSSRALIKSTPLQGYNFFFSASHRVDLYVLHVYCKMGAHFEKCGKVLTPDGDFLITYTTYTSFYIIIIHYSRLIQ